MDFSLWEAYHLINLRTSEEAQWDIRETFEELFKQLYTVHPLLISQAKRRP
ncbi:Thymidylate synthase ThyX [compost metagenome]